MKSSLKEVLQRVHITQQCIILLCTFSGKASDAEACLNLKDVEEATLKPELPAKMDLVSFGMAPKTEEAEEADNQTTESNGEGAGMRPGWVFMPLPRFCFRKNVAINLLVVIPSANA